MLNGTTPELQHRKYTVAVWPENPFSPLMTRPQGPRINSGDILILILVFDISEWQRHLANIFQFFKNLSKKSDTKIRHKNPSNSWGKLLQKRVIWWLCILEMEKQFRKLLCSIANFISPEKLLFCYYTFFAKRWFCSNFTKLVVEFHAWGYKIQ